MRLRLALVVAALALVALPAPASAAFRQFIMPSRVSAEPLRQQPVAEPVVVDLQRVGPEQRQHGADDARPTEDDLRALRLQAGDAAPLLRVRPR